MLIFFDRLLLARPRTLVAICRRRFVGSTSVSCSSTSDGYVSHPALKVSQRITHFSSKATMVVLINVHVTSLSFQPTLLTVVGTVLGFVVSYRTTSSFERYNEGRRLWSQIIMSSRILARAVWFHVPGELGIKHLKLAFLR